jgi:UDP-glucose 4-epimerase
VREVLAAFERICGRKISTRAMPRRAGDVASVTARVPEMAGQATLRDLDAICADAWRWQRNGGRY